MELIKESEWIKALEDPKAVRGCYKTLEAEAHGHFRPVSPFCNLLIGVLCRNLDHFAFNYETKSLVQLLIREPRYWRQRDYIIDNLVLNHVLELSQDRFGSQIVELCFECSSPERLQKLFKEVLHHYKPLETESPSGSSRIALEIMMFDQFGNYVVQHMYKAAREVVAGHRPGSPYWLPILVLAIERNRQALSRTTSGKQILCLLDEPKG